MNTLLSHPVPTPEPTTYDNYDGMAISPPPNGHAIIESGPIITGDLAWLEKTQTWVACPNPLNYPAEHYACICRKTQTQAA